ncbi:hypothetical protein [Cryptosporangium aurantiacum]|uniref:Uncharacterized protein n=1 Tax=Cryptosporangium aurantiacum TaxID=134849 RepID=A0A1M7REJ0_9ACTN|nr:hypothetical protein [Cryptosporangium aurantiacum]SHN44636.1 hypothetical protein SAMN05443668_110292 [Cryptosporangium aurantiacum]
MSEYQCYEFLALDRPLTDAQMAEVRALSTRAEITATRFVNSYHWGSFRGDPHRMVERYYDAHLYVTNWGTRQVILRIPKTTLALDVVEPYCLDDESFACWTTKTHLILSLCSEDDEDDFDGTAEHALHSLAGLRAELAAGDLRPLYLAWLSALGKWEREDDNEDAFRKVTEPAVPAGLNTLTAAQRALADFLRVDRDLLEAAAQASGEPVGVSVTRKDLEPLVAALPEREKNSFLVRCALGQEPGLPAVLRNRLLPHPEPPAAGRRTAAELLDAAYRTREARHQEAVRAAEEDERRQAAARTAARERRLSVVTGQGESAWKRVEDHIAAKKASDYDAALDLLTDLHEISNRTNDLDHFRNRLNDLRHRHHNKPALLRRLTNSELP